MGGIRTVISLLASGGAMSHTFGRSGILLEGESIPGGAQF